MFFFVFLEKSASEFFRFSITGINYILKYIQIETVILNCNNISQYYLMYCIFDQTNAALVRITDFFLKLFFLNLTNPQLLNIGVN